MLRTVGSTIRELGKNHPAIFFLGSSNYGEDSKHLIDELGDVEFIKDASKYRIITLVIFNQNAKLNSHIYWKKYVF